MAVKVSVVIPNYNRAHTIRRAVDSVLAQDFTDTEIIVVDDGSTDESCSVLAEYGDRIAVLRQENQGVAAARNNGIMTAQGELVAFLDSDDAWFPNKLARQIAILEEHPNVGLVSSGAVDVDDLGAIMGKRNPGSWCGRITEVLLQRNRIVTSSVLVRKTCLTSVQPLFRTEFSPAEDWELWIRLSVTFDFCVLPEALIWYTISPGSLDRKFELSTYRQLHNSIYASLAQEDALGELVVRQRRRLDANIHLYSAIKAYEKGALWSARGEAIRSVICSPLSVKWDSVLSMFMPPLLRNACKRGLYR